MAFQPCDEMRQWLLIKPCAVVICELADEGKGRNIGQRSRLAAQVFLTAQALVQFCEYCQRRIAVSQCMSDI